MKKPFAVLPDGQQTYAYTISCGKLTAEILDLGATLRSLYVPDRAGNLADVVLGFDTPDVYLKSSACFGAVVSRNCNRIKDGRFTIGEKAYQLPQNQSTNSLHSGPDFHKNRVWEVEQVEDSRICLRLNSPDGDQGFPGNAVIRVTYSLEPGGVLRIAYDAVSDKDTIFNMTNHSFFNLAGHQNTSKAMDQLLCMPARYYTVADAKSIPTGEMRSVEGTPMDFRIPKAIKADIGQDYEALNLQKGYDHNFEVFSEPGAILTDPGSGRSMAIYTDCPGIHVYSGNYLQGELGKDGVEYHYRSGIALETQFYPDAVHHPQWRQPITKAGQHYRSETRYIFK